MLPILALMLRTLDISRYKGELWVFIVKYMEQNGHEISRAHCKNLLFLYELYMHMFVLLKAVDPVILSRDVDDIQTSCLGSSKCRCPRFRWSCFFQWTDLGCWVVKCNITWYDMTWYAMIWREMLWYHIWHDMIWYDIWYDMIWYDMIWYDMIWYMLRKSTDSVYGIWLYKVLGIWKGYYKYDMMWCDVMS